MPTRQGSPAKIAPAVSASQDSVRADALFASIGEGIIATDSKGNITRMNQVALDILGYKKSEVIGKWFPSKIIAVHENGLPVDVMERPIGKAYLIGETVSERALYKRKDGLIVPVFITVSPVLYKGKPVGSIEVFRDIRHEIESDKMKTQFISVASHQLRTPLSAINMYSRMLVDGLAGDMNDAQRAFLDTILNSVDRMNHLINTLLNITRIEAGGVAINLAAVDMPNLIREIIKEAEPQAKEKNIKLTSKIDEKLPLINTDNLLLKEVFVNLLSNALKYTPAGGSVNISLQKEDHNVVLSVKDTGYGIPAAAQKHIFTKFFRAENIVTQDVSGTGLGLYLTKTIAENLNGELWFNSRENKGSTFSFSLPLKGSIEKTGKFKLEV